MAKKCGCGFAKWLKDHNRIDKAKYESMCKKAIAKCEKKKG